MPSVENNDSNTNQVILTPLKPALIQGVAQKLPVLVRVQSPDADPSQVKARSPYHLALVIDRSGSMAGEPLREAVRCARHIVDRLAPSDLATLVTFDERVRTLVPAAPVGNRKALHIALSRIIEGGTTNLYGGWEEGANALGRIHKGAALSRVILLSDGNANAGETDVPTIISQCALAAENGVTTSTYGLGRSFNEDLMVEMAKKGLGNHYYGDTAADLFEPFAEEFDLISNLYGRKVKLALGAPQGVKIKLLNDYPVEERDGFPLVRLPDLPWGAEAWVLVELEIAASLALESGNPILQAGVSGITPEGQPIAFREALLALNAMPVAAWEALLPDALVAERLAELEAGKLLEQARTAGAAGDWAAIKQLLEEARRRFANYPWVVEVLEGMDEIARMQDRERFMKEALYSSRKMNTRLSAKGESSALAMEALAPSFLRRKKSQGKAQFKKPDDQ